MDFIVNDDHTEHDASWTIYSSLHNHPVCLGCIVEILENTQLLPLKRKPALTEFHRLLTQQPAQLLQLFIAEERIVWHILSVLMESLSSDEESYIALTVEAKGNCTDFHLTMDQTESLYLEAYAQSLLRLVQVVGSEDLVTAILDKTVQQVQNTTNRKKLLPHYMLLGKMLYQLPALADTLLIQYVWLLHELSLDLCNDGETVQSAIAYIFIFLCDVSQNMKLSARTLHQVHSGTLRMLSTAQSLPVLVNGLGLLKKLVVDDSGCENLMTLTEEGVTLLTCLKKLMLSKKDTLQTGVSQILSLILRRDTYKQYAVAILESDIVDIPEILEISLIIKEILKQLIKVLCLCSRCILKVLQRLSHVDQFYKRCHSVYGVESILRALTTALELKTPSLLNHGYRLLEDILNRHPEDIPLFLSCTLVQKCLYLIQQGLGHHQTAISHTAQDTFSAVLRKKYLLSPVPFQELITMVSIVTRRKQEQMKAFWNLPETKQLKNTEIMVTSLERYLDLFVNSCKLLLQCRDDLTSCESNFAAPGSQEGPSPMETFTDMLFESANSICNLVTMKSAARFESPDLYVKALEFFCSLRDLDGMKTCDIVFQLISAGFIVSLIEVKVKYGLPQLTSLIQRFMSLIQDCGRRKGFLPADGYLEEILNVENFKWHFSSLPQVFRDGNAELECIESYLTVLYLSCKYSDCENRLNGLDDIICSVLNGHVSLDKFTALGRKHFIYLLSYVSVFEGTSIIQAIPCGLETLPLIMQGPACDWYTHDISMLEWVFSDPVLAGTSGQSVIEAFMDNTSLEMMQNILETEGCVECEAMLKLCQNRTYLSGLVTRMACSTVDNVTKISLCLEVYLYRSASVYQTEEENTEHEPKTDQVDFLFDKTTEVLQGVFLQNFPHIQDHNIVGLLQLLLLMIKCSQSTYSVSVKVLYHVLNMLSKEIEGREDLERVCMLTVLAAVTCNCESQSQTSLCAIVVQHEGFLSYLQTCLDRSRADVMYCIACDILRVLIQSKNLKCDSPVKIKIAKLVDALCAAAAGDCQVASMNLLTALFSVNMNSTVVTVAGRIYSTNYRRLFIQLQQCCLQENTDSASGAVSCMRSLISNLHLSDKDMGEELLSQPWNKMLLDVILDLTAPENISEHHLGLMCLFTEFETGCNLIKSTTGLLSKLVKFVQLANKEVEEPLRMHCVTLLKQLQSNFEDVLSEENVKWLKENRV